MKVCEGYGIYGSVELEMPDLALFLLRLWQSSATFVVYTKTVCKHST